jgi:hypothetical protein
MMAMQRVGLLVSVFSLVLGCSGAGTSGEFGGGDASAQGEAGTDASAGSEGGVDAPFADAGSDAKDDAPRPPPSDPNGVPCWNGPCYTPNSWCCHGDQGSGCGSTNRGTCPRRVECDENADCGQAEPYCCVERFESVGKLHATCSPAKCRNNGESRWACKSNADCPAGVECTRIECSKGVTFWACGALGYLPSDCRQY